MSASAVEQFSRIAADGAGDRVRTLELELLQSDGTRATVAMQVMVLSDTEGTAVGSRLSPLHVDSMRLGGLIEDLTAEVRRLRELLQVVHGMTLED